MENHTAASLSLLTAVLVEWRLMCSSIASAVAYLLVVVRSGASRRVLPTLTMFQTAIESSL